MHVHTFLHTYVHRYPEVGLSLSKAGRGLLEASLGLRGDVRMYGRSDPGCSTGLLHPFEPKHKKERRGKEKKRRKRRRQKRRRRRKC